MINNRSMAGPRRVDTQWPQTDLIDRRRAPRRRDHAYRRKNTRRVDWLAVVLLLAAAMVGLALVYKLTGPAL